MNGEDWEDYERFVIAGSRVVWSDIEHARHLRHVIGAGMEQLDILRGGPRKQWRDIADEEMKVSQAKRELARLERRFLTE